ncbi:hypothetical protein GCM10007916_18710 [Psychromonas marina]|uniref:Uncharacterized protein n=1 Tax=Psychromonas marina TaxID=88364 RepID=A0ABQ6E0L8_9GAMM|nr:hypothetical protein GCM10007916_18710 [Psychromonas marina]
MINTLYFSVFSRTNNNIEIIYLAVSMLKTSLHILYKSQTPTTQIAKKTYNKME